MTESGIHHIQHVEGHGLNTQFGQFFAKDIENKRPPHTQETLAVLKEIDKQALQSVGLFESETFPGTKLSYTMLEVSPSVIQRIFTPEREDPFAESDTPPSESWFLFGGFDKPPRGGAHHGLDMGMDRFFRSLGKAGRSLREGEKTGPIYIYSLGSGTGIGEVVTQAYIDSINTKDGFDGRGKVGAEFIQKALKGTGADENTKVGLEGVSMGTTTVDATLAHLPSELAERAMKRLISPAGIHSPKHIHRTVQLASVGLEDIYRKTFSEPMKFMKRQAEPSFNARLSAQFPPGSPEQEKLKKQLATKSGQLLFKGNPLKKEAHRYYISSGMYDPLTTGPKKMIEGIVAKKRARVTPSQKAFKKLLLQRAQLNNHPDPLMQSELDSQIAYYKNNVFLTRDSRKPQATGTYAKSEGRSIDIPFNHTHYFGFTNSYERWGKLAEFAKNSAKIASNSDELK